MWLVPMCISAYSHFEHMLEAWTIFTVVTGWIAFKATRRPLHAKTPRYALCCDIGGWDKG